MNRRQIDTFFRVLAEQSNEKVTILLTGAAAGAVWGHVRPSVDVDFAVQLRTRGKKTWEKVEAAIERTVRLTGIQANYAEDIDRWGLITLLDYKRRARPYRRFGLLQVRLLDPAYWSVGKMTRYLAPQGAFQQMLGGAKPAQMLRVTLPDEATCFPEVSANKYAINIRFNCLDGTQKPRPCEADVTFDLTLCNL